MLRLHTDTQHTDNTYEVYPMQISFDAVIFYNKVTQEANGEVECMILWNLINAFIIKVYDKYSVY